MVEKLKIRLNFTILWSFIIIQKTDLINQFVFHLSGLYDVPDIKIA